MLLLDAIVLVTLLCLISFYGLYKSFKQRTESLEEILHGSNVSILSSALSVCSGFISAISILGFTAEIYYYGAMMFWYNMAYIIAFPIVAFIFLPISYKLKYTSIYEYLERRFCFPCRFLASTVFCIQMLLYLSVVLYTPALALSSILAIPIWLSILTTAGLSAFYVSVGGAKAGIHTSSLQMALILISMMAILVCSLLRANISEVLEIAKRGGRLQMFEFHADPRIRHSVWSLLIGGTFNIIYLYAGNQLTVQRYLAMPSLRHAKFVVLLNIPFVTMMMFSYVGIGILIYYFYHSCHPILNASDQLLPHFVSSILSDIPGINGLFIASIYSASISTLSASYSALTAVIIEDLIKQFYLKCRDGQQLHSDTVIKMTKVYPIILCSLTMALAYACSYLKRTVLLITLSIFGIAGGPILGVFCLGYFFPFIKQKAAFWAQASSTIFCALIAVGVIYEGVRPIELPLDRSCRLNTTYVQFNASDYTYSMVKPLNSTSWLVQIYRVSYQYYTLIAVLVSIVVAFLVQIVSELLYNEPNADSTILELNLPMLSNTNADHIEEIIHY